MSGFNMPPGVSPHDIPGNSAEDEMRDQQEEIDAAARLVAASGQFRITRIQPPLGVCQTCWGSGRAASGVDGGSWVPCPSCAK